MPEKSKIISFVKQQILQYKNGKKNKWEVYFPLAVKGLKYR